MEVTHETPPQETANLPSPQEIEKHHGWPTAEEEQSLKINFTNTFADQLPQIMPEATKFTPNDTRFLLSVLYGFYFFNYVVGGAVIGPDRDANQLSNWPLTLTNMADKAGISNLTDQLEINPSWIKKYGSRDPDKPIDYKQGERPLFPFLKYTSPFNPRASLGVATAFKVTPTEYGEITGLEEAHHLLLIRLEEHPNAVVANELRNIHLDSMLDRKRYSRNIDTVDDYALKSAFRYHSEIDYEFRATSAKAIFVKRYRPRLWEDGGFKQFVEQVRQSRKEFVSA